MAKKSNLKRARYHNAEGLPAVDVVVLKENSDGTVDLGNEAGDLVIGKCPVREGEGGCTILEDKAPEQPTP